MNNTNIEALRAQVAKVQTENEEKIKMAAEVARLEATLALETSEELFDARIRIEAASQQTTKLETLVAECAAIIDSVPVFNTKTRANREWAGKHRFDFGTQVDLMYQLATGILYSCAEHRQLLLTHSGLNQELLTQLVEGFGTPTYYSRNHHVIVEAKPYDTAKALAAINVMQSILGVVVDTSLVKDETFSLEAGKAQKTAYDNLTSAEEAIKEADFTL